MGWIGSFDGNVVGVIFLYNVSIGVDDIVVFDVLVVLVWGELIFGKVVVFGNFVLCIDVGVIVFGDVFVGDVDFVSSGVLMMMVVISSGVILLKGDMIDVCGVLVVVW